MAETKVDMPMQVRTGSVRADSIDVEARTVDLVWSTGSEVLRQDWWTGKRYKESLSLDPAHVRMDRLNGGAPVLDTHDTWSLASVIGVVQSATVDGNEGRATVRFARTAEVDPIWAKVEQGIVRNVSVGYRVHTYEKTEREDGPDDWRATDWEPMELSFVPVGADPGAGVRAENTKTFPCTIRALPEPAHVEEIPMSDAVSGNPPVERSEEGATPAAVVVETRTEKKVASATEITAAMRALKRSPDDILGMVERAEKDSLSIEAVREIIINEAAEKDTVETRNHVQITQDEVDTTRSLAENAILHRFDPGKHKLEDGARQFMGRSLLEVGTDLLERRGTSTRGLDKMQRAGLVLGMDVRSGGMHTTSDFPYILANVANKTLRAGYDSAARTFLPFCRRTTLPDFKQASRVQLGSAPQLKEVNEHGEFSYGTIGEGREVYQLATYGRIVAVTRQTIINDDLSAFTRIPQLMGNAAANLESDTIYGILNTNANLADGNALFSTAHANFTDTGTAPDVSSIGTGMVAIGSQTGLDSDDTTYLNLMGRYLVGGWLTHTLRAQYTSPNFQPTAQSGVNPYTGLIPITDARITTTAWYIAASPDQVDTIEYAYLDGQEGVYTETRVGFEVDGVEIKARHDFAAKAIDYRGLYRNDGAGN